MEDDMSKKLAIKSFKCAVEFAAQMPAYSFTSRSIRFVANIKPNTCISIQ